MDKRFSPTLVLVLVIFFILVYAGRLVSVFVKVGTKKKREISTNIDLLIQDLSILYPVGV